MRKTGMIKRMIATLCLCTVVSISMSGCNIASVKKEIKSSLAETNKSEAKKIVSPEDTTSNLGLWARAMGSVLIYLNDGSPYVFGGYEVKEVNRKGAVNILSSSWEITNRAELIEQIYFLLKEGHRASYRAEAKTMAKMTKKELKKSFQQLEGEVLTYYEMIYDNWKTWKKKGLLAWDLCRISHLVQWGYIAGYITVEEAQALIEPAAKRLKANFSSWEEVQNNWLDGFCVFACIDKSMKNTDYTNRKALYEQLKEEQKENGVLYDDTLFEKEIIPISNVSYKTLFAELKK